jgi:hypothetical protein
MNTKPKPEKTIFFIAKINRHFMREKEIVFATSGWFGSWISGVPILFEGKKGKEMNVAFPI